MLNTAGHVLQIGSRDDRYREQLEPASYLCWLLGMYTAISSAAIICIRGDCVKTITEATK